MSEENQSKARGGCLTAFLWVFTILAGLGTVLDLVAVFRTPGPSSIISTLITIVSLASLIAILLWKKIGVIGYVVAEVASTIVSLVNNSTTVNAAISPTISKTLTVVFAVIILAIFYALIKPVYKNLD